MRGSNTEHLQLNVKHGGGSGDAVHPVVLGIL